MMGRLFNKKGQSTLEYAVLIAVVVGALLAIQIYMKRGIQGKLRDAAGDIGSQYEPGETESEWTTSRSSKTKEETEAGISSTYMDSGGKGAKEVTTRKGYEKVSPW